MPLYSVLNGGPSLVRNFLFQRGIQLRLPDRAPTKNTGTTSQVHHIGGLLIRTMRGRHGQYDSLRMSLESCFTVSTLRVDKPIQGLFTPFGVCLMCD